MNASQQLLLSGAVFVALAMSMALGMSRLQRTWPAPGRGRYAAALAAFTAFYLAVFVMAHQGLVLACNTCVFDAVLYKGVISTPVVVVLLAWRRMRPAGPKRR